MNVASIPIATTPPKVAALHKPAADPPADQPVVNFNALLSLLIGDTSQEDQNLKEQDASPHQSPGATNRKEDGIKKEDSLPVLSSTLLSLGHSPQLSPLPQPRPGDNAPKLDGALNGANAPTAPLMQVQALEGIPNPANDKRLEPAAGNSVSKEDLGPSVAKTSTAPSTAPIAFAAHLTETRGSNDKQNLPVSSGKDTVAAPSHSQRTTPIAPVQNSKNPDQNPNLNQPKEKPPPSAKPTEIHKDGSATPSDPAPPANLAAPSSPDVSNTSRQTPKTTAPSSAAAESAQVESKSDTNLKLRPQPAREISLRLPGADAGGVDLRITEKAGKVQVTVRTDDEALSHSLRSDLGELVGRLEKKGFTTETWVPGDKAGEHLTTTESAGAQSDPGKQHSGDGSEQGGGSRHQGQNRRPQWMNDPETNFTVEEQGEID